MTPTCLALLAAALTAVASDPVAPAADDKKAAPAAADTKVVRKIWFPRFSPDGTMVLAAHGGWDRKEGGEARLYSAKDGAVLHVFPLPRGVRTVAWSPKGDFFVAGGYGFGIRGFDVKEKKELFHLVGTWQVENLRVTSDAKTLA